MRALSIIKPEPIKTITIDSLEEEVCDVYDACVEKIASVKKVVKSIGKDEKYIYVLTFENMDDFELAENDAN